jgi:hypothetical protein
MKNYCFNVVSYEKPFYSFTVTARTIFKLKRML